MAAASRVRVVVTRVAAGSAVLAALVLVVWLMVVLRRVLPDDASGNGGSLTAPAIADEQPGTPTASQTRSHGSSRQRQTLATDQR